MKDSLIELLILSEGREDRFVARASQGITIGRSPDCAVVIDNPYIAPHQARLVWIADDSLTLDPINPLGPLVAVGGLRLEGERITAPVTVREGQKLTIGPVVLTWCQLPEEEWPTVAAKTSGPARGQSAAARLVKELNEGRYEIGTEVGRGGMGKVLEALEKPLLRPVALKMLRGSGDDEDQKRFIREARITGGLQHPSIVPVYELNVDTDGRVFYTMKLVRGQTLLQILQDLAAGKRAAVRRYPLPALLTVFQKVCDAVAFAHAQPKPIVHRDLKPENIMVGDYGEVLVMDWGAAKILQPKGETKDSESDEEDRGESTSMGNDETPDPFVTRPGSVMGTPEYMAPEQARGQAANADQRTDIYALGALLYALLTLEAPVKMTTKEAHDFEERRLGGEEVTQIFRRYIAPLLSDRSARQKLDHLPARTVPDSLVPVVLKAMALCPEDRFTSVKKLQADVAAYQAGFATSAEEARAWKRFKLLIGRNKVLFTALATIFAILLAATAVSLYQRKAVVESNKGLQLTLHRASFADHETARQRFRAGAWREGLALMERSLNFWPDNREAANYLLSAIVFGHGDGDRLPIFGVHQGAGMREGAFSPDGRYFATASQDHTTCVWDTATGAQVGKTLRHAGPCCMPCFSPDGRQLLTTGEDGVANALGYANWRTFSQADETWPARSRSLKHRHCWCL
ncbi:MAG: protein kinase [Chthoniobacterales bacterium]|nr:protein kinase [Chthoniobacterales bacterium]